LRLRRKLASEESGGRVRPPMDAASLSEYTRYKLCPVMMVRSKKPNLQAAASERLVALRRPAPAARVVSENTRELI
jgi:hypothetical protein